MFFLKETANLVHITSDIFLEIAKLFEEESVDMEKLNKLINKTYTVMLTEDGHLIGPAGMDKEGYINIFAVCALCLFDNLD